LTVNKSCLLFPQSTLQVWEIQLNSLTPRETRVKLVHQY